MRVCLIALVALGYCWAPANGFGYITSSRFRPESGYGNWGSASGYRSAFPQRVSSPREQLLEALLAGADQDDAAGIDAGCGGRSCNANEHCCLDHICMAFQGRASGTCMATGNQRGGDECVNDGECGDGMQCDLGVCLEAQGSKAYGEECTSSAECENSRGLCCQMIRRHRQKPRKMCSYYKDPMICLGRVSSGQSRHASELTRGEKRLTGRSRNYATGFSITK